MRPTDISGDMTPVSHVVDHCVEWLREHDVAPMYTCLVFCNAFIQADDIARGWELLAVNKCANSFSVTEYCHPIERALHYGDNDLVKMYHPEHRYTRTQDCDKSIYDAGQFYWSDVIKYSSQENNKDLWADATSVMIPRERNVDIDNPQDWAVSASVQNL